MCNRKSRDMHRNIELKVKFEANTHKCSFVMARIGQPLRWMNENRKLPFDLGEEVKRLSLWTRDYNYSDLRAMSILTRDLLCVHVECKFSKCKSFSRFFHSPALSHIPFESQPPLVPLKYTPPTWIEHFKCRHRTAVLIRASLMFKCDFEWTQLMHLQKMWSHISLLRTATQQPHTLHQTRASSAFYDTLVRKLTNILNFSRH